MQNNMVPTTEAETKEAAILYDRIILELETFKQKGTFIRNIGTGSAVAAGMASLLPPLGIVALLAGVAGSSLAILKQRERDNKIEHWNNRLNQAYENQNLSERNKEFVSLLEELKNENKS